MINNQNTYIMKKLSFLFALLCVSVMGFSTQYCEFPTGHLSNPDFGDASGRILLTLQKDGNNVIVKIKNNNANGNPQTGLNYMWVNAAGATNNNATYGSHSTANTEEISVTVEFAVAQDSYTFNNIHWAYEGFGGEWAIDGLTVAASELCTAGSKPSPELSLNATSKTLEIDATAETFQIVASKAAGSGAVSYSSNAEGVATVSNTGLVTAVGNGTATITVSVAENDDFAADSKTLTVEVIDWPNIGWLTNSGDAYKLHISPDISDGFGGKRIEGSNLWVGCPSAEFGACSIDFTHVGAGASFPLSNFTGTRSQFTLVCQGTTYTFTVYRRFEGVNLAKNMPSYAGAVATPKADANDGNKGSRWASGAGAKHYPAYKDMAEDWWYVDLGAMYEISAIKTLFEGAAPKNYDFLTSPNGDSWVVIDSYNATPKIGNTDADYNEYNYSPGKVGRYVKIFAREAVQADFAYGISIWEFEVYGAPAEGYDVNSPVLISASLSGVPTASQVQIAVSATDTEGAVTIYRVKDSSNGIDRNCTVAAGVITISDLSEGTNYNFTVTALDAIGNQSNAIVVAASTEADPTVPQVAAPTPVGTGKDVLAIYSDVFPNILAHPFDKDGFAGMPLYKEKNISGDNCLIYDRSGSAPTFTTWGMYDDGANAIIAATGYSDPNDAGHKGVYASEMANLHIDIWSLQACATILIRINDGQRTGSLRLSHSGEGWESFDIPLSEFEDAANTNNVRWFKFEAFDAVTGKIALDNVYFWRPASGSYTVSASVNSGEMGSATAKVGDDEVTIVTAGTDVTFTATPNSGYDFVNWTNAGVEVSTSATYVATITANTALVANFELHRDAYCHAAILTNNNAQTMYLTCSMVAENTYKIHVDGTAEAPIESRYNYDFAITGSGVTYDAVSWTTDNTGYGSAEVTFTATDISAITMPNKYLCFNKQGGGLIEFGANIPAPNVIAWKNTCTDETAPVLTAPTASTLNSTDVRLTLSATDNWAGTITYNINYKPTGSAGSGTDVTPAPTGESGVTITYDVTGLTTGVEYTFSVTATDEHGNTCSAQSCTATPEGDVEAPVITSFTATASYGFVDLAVTATDDMAGDLTYTITYGTEEEIVVGAAGSEATKRIFTLPNTALSFSVIATDAASHTSAAAVANATTLTIPAAPVPMHVAAAVRSVYSNAYSPAVASTFWRANFGSSTPISENDDILYRMTANVIVWGHNSGSAGAGNIDAISPEYAYGENTGLDVSGMKYIHFDIFCDVDNQLNTVNINDQPIAIPTIRTIAGQWVSFDVDITGVALGDRQNVRWLKFHPFNSTNCLAVIDNVYFYKDPEYTRTEMLGAGVLGTICVNHNVVAYEGATFYELNGRNSEGKIAFDQITSGELTAGKPYVFQANGDNLRLYYGNVTADEPVNSNGMYGTFTEVVLSGSELEGVYYFAEKALWSCNGAIDLTIPANRAYVKLSEIPDATMAPAPGRMRLLMNVNGHNTPTGISNTEVSDKPIKKLIEGQLFIIRGEKMYNANGILVK